jgi:hypothetical protein
MTLKLGTFKVPDGKMIKIRMREENKRILEIQIMGDFFLHPETTLALLEEGLVGVEISKLVITDAINTILVQSDSVLVGADPEDIAQAIIKAK